MVFSELHLRGYFTNAQNIESHLLCIQNDIILRFATVIWFNVPTAGATTLLYILTAFFLNPLSTNNGARLVILRFISTNDSMSHKISKIFTRLGPLVVASWRNREKGSAFERLAVVRFFVLSPPATAWISLSLYTRDRAICCIQSLDPLLYHYDLTDRS